MNWREKLENWRLAVIPFVAFGVGLLYGFGFGPTTTKVKVVPARPTTTIYIENRAKQYISDRQIRRDIPAWEYAANEQLAPIWGTPQVDLKLVQSVPTGGIAALFVGKGPVQGALAYHGVQSGMPVIVVYAGTGDYYGYSNSVSFTHELFELLADPTISQTNQGYPYPSFCLEGAQIAPALTTGEQCQFMDPGTIWYQEIADPVEAASYYVDGVAISDFITPNWFNDEQGNNGYDFMTLVQHPFAILKGGYGQYWDGLHWQAVVNFRHAGRDAAGFFKGEGEHGRRR